MDKECCFIYVCLISFITTGLSEKIRDEEKASEFVRQFSDGASEFITASAIASWNSETNITTHNQQAAVEAYLRLSSYMREGALNATQYAWRDLQNDTTRRLFQSMAYVGTAVLDHKQVQQVETLESEMRGLYSSAQVCDRLTDINHTCYQLEPGLTEVMSTSRDWSDLEWAWRGWRDVTGKQYKDKYLEYVELVNKAARIEGFADAGEYWLHSYETDNFDDVIGDIWSQVKPLYQQLHAYVRRKLMHHYSNHSFPDTGHIPVHLLGNMWGQSWQSITDLLLPYPDTPFPDVTSVLRQQGYTPLRMFQTADEFFQSLGLDPLPDAFWEHSMIEKPTDGRNVVCHASAWNFHNDVDYRIKMCTVVTMEDFYTIHHEMGHIQYYLEYKHLPLKFRTGANPGFHEAVGDVISLSVTTPEHLHKIGLLHQVVNNTEYDLNYLLVQALKKLAFLPFGYLVDQWRWQVFSGDVTPDTYNKHWWHLRCGIQGVSPPVARSEEDFDAGSKYHVPGNVPYIRYFVAHVIQFQFYKALCDVGGYTGPLHRCDFYNSKKAGETLRSMLRMGSSRPWQDAMEEMTGQRRIDAGPLIEYFTPILDWLREENAGYDVTWDESACPDGSFVETSAASETNCVKFISMVILLFVGIIII